MPASTIWGVIPARYHSTRFPGKPLASFQGRPMIQWVYERAIQFGKFDRVVVATDDDRIFKAVQSFGGDVQMTSTKHRTGTERVAEVVADQSVDYVVNIQGDEPLIPSIYFEKIYLSLTIAESDIATLVLPITSGNDLFSPNAVKVVTDLTGKAVYFSRSPIPYCRDINQKDWADQGIFMRHIGLYGFKKSILEKLVHLPVTSLERFEKLEQLRWIEHGYEIMVRSVQEVSYSVDTPEDLVRLEEMVKKGALQLPLS